MSTNQLLLGILIVGALYLAVGVLAAILSFCAIAIRRKAPPPIRGGYAAPPRWTSSGGQRAPNVAVPDNVPTCGPRSAVCPPPPRRVEVVIRHETPPPPCVCDFLDMPEGGCGSPICLYRERTIPTQTPRMG